MIDFKYKSWLDAEGDELEIEVWEDGDFLIFVGGRGFFATEGQLREIAKVFQDAVESIDKNS